MYKIVIFCLFGSVITRIDCNELESNKSIGHHAVLAIDNLQPQLSSLERIQRLTGYDSDYNKENYEKFRQNNSEIVELSSENYPLPYPPESHSVWNVDIDNGTGIELIVHFLDIDFNSDFLTILQEGQTSAGLTLTGKIKVPFRMRVLQNTHLKIEFKSNTKVDHDHKGFLITYAPYGNKTESETSEPPEEVTIAPENLKTFSIVLTLDERKQTNETWNLCRNLLCQATENFTRKHNLTLEECHPNNVTFVSVQTCHQLLPDSQNCIEIVFSILLRDNTTESVAAASMDNPLLADLLTFPEELTEEHLKEMWSEFGRSLFASNRLVEYEFPNTNSVILFWGGMTMAAIIVLVMFLVILSKLPILWNYVRWSGVEEDADNILKKSQDIDITMFPSPHQVVPTLFPNGSNAYSQSSSFLYEGDVYDNRPADVSDHLNEIDRNFELR